MPVNNTAAQENIELMRNAFAVLSRRDITAAAEFLTPDFIINLAGVPHQIRGREKWRKNTGIFLDAFPDFKLEEQDMFAAGDKVAVRFRITGTHSGEFLGHPPTGKRVDYQSYELYRIADGKIAEEWICSDMLTLMAQIGGGGYSMGKLGLMWLAGYRVWFALGLGVAVGALTMAVLPF